MVYEFDPLKMKKTKATKKTGGLKPGLHRLRAEFFLEFQSTGFILKNHHTQSLFTALYDTRSPSAGMYM